MIFNQHSRLEGKHAFLSPSQHSWTNYDDIKLRNRYFASSAARRGSELHELASRCITLGVPLSRSTGVLGAYVNDAIKLGMKAEQPLFYSENCFGTADAISFGRKKLRIHDLKTGITHTKERQLEVYAALFCLEYGVAPHDITIELRIYQGEDVRIFDPHPDLIGGLMERIVYFDQLIEDIKESERY